MQLSLPCAQGACLGDRVVEAGVVMRLGAAPCLTPCLRHCLQAWPSSLLSQLTPLLVTYVQASFASQMFYLPLVIPNSQHKLSLPMALG